MIGQNYESTLRAFIGPNADYYLSEFRKIENGEKTSITWRGLLGGLPLLYRKMVKNYFIVFLICLIPIVGIFLVIPKLFKMNKLYYEFVNRKLAQNGLTGVDVEQAGGGTAAKVKALGGTSVGLMIGIFASMMAACFVFLAVSSLFVGMLTMMYSTAVPEDPTIYDDPISAASSIAEAEESQTDSVSFAAEASIAPYDFYELLQDNEMIPFQMSKKSSVFLQEHPELFPTQDERIVQDYTDIEIGFKHLQKNINLYGDRLIKSPTTMVIKIEETEMDDGTILSELNLIDEAGLQYYMIYIGSLEDVYQDDVLSVWGLPLSMVQFANTGGGTSVAPLLAGSYVEKLNS